MIALLKVSLVRPLGELVLFCICNADSPPYNDSHSISRVRGDGTRRDRILAMARMELGMYVPVFGGEISYEVFLSLKH